MKIVTVFGSAHPLPTDSAYTDALRLGAALAQNGFGICNGGYGGTMEAAAKGAQSAGGHTIGVTLTTLDQDANAWIREEIRTASLEERLRTLASRGDAYVVLPGGTGTLLELAYVLELMNKRFVTMRPVVLYKKFWYPVLDPLRTDMNDMKLGHLGEHIVVAEGPEDVVRILKRDLARPS